MSDSYFGVWNGMCACAKYLELSFTDLAAAVDTRNLEGMPTFDVQAMVRGYDVYHHDWDASIHEELPCAREADNLRDPSLHQLAEVKQLRYFPQIWHERCVLY